MFRKYKIKNFSVLLVLLILALTIIGIMVIGSASIPNQNRQIIGMILGITVMAFICVVDYEVVIKYYWVCYFLACLMLLLVLILGSSKGGATRWFAFDAIGLQFQPSEIGKILLVVFFARFLGDNYEKLNTPKMLAQTIGLAAIPLFLIEKEPDLSTTIVTLLIICAMMFTAGLTYKIIVPILAVSIPVISVVIWNIVHGTSKLLNGYQNKRILSWLRPEDYPQDAYQQQNSIMAIGSGQIFGKGLNNDSFESVKNGNYISEPHTDFIFAVAGEELGFLGTVIIILLIFAITLEIIHIGNIASDVYGKLICVGIAALFGVQSFVNICVVTGIMPNTGIPLPFVSYGLTSLVTSYIGIGLVLNVGLQSKERGGRKFL